MTLEDLKEYNGSTPTEIIEYIESNQSSSYGTNYVAWLEKNEDEVIYRVWAYKTTKKYGLQYREVIRSILGKENVIYRDIYFHCMGGYSVVFSSSTGKRRSYGYTYYIYTEDDFGKWWTEKKIGVYPHILNMDILKDTKFKYSGYQGNGDFLEWMQVYAEYPEVEYLGKLGFPPSKRLLKKASKDKAFRKYLSKANPHDNINAICYAYDHDMSAKDSREILMKKQEAGRRFHGNKYIKKANVNLLKALDYVTKVKCNASSYCDYIEACYCLGLDMKDTKNLFPEDFERMHMLRTNQWDSKRNKKKHAEFKKAATNYVKYEFKGDKYSIIIPKKLVELREEGAILHHCVGKMGYDSKMIKGETFIAFVRKNDSLDTPFVTVEVACKTKKILQCYGDHDSKPKKEVSSFVNSWSKEIKKIA